MKKNTLKRKLQLVRATVRSLTDGQLDGVRGGTLYPMAIEAEPIAAEGGATPSVPTRADLCGISALTRTGCICSNFYTV
jgi:hypothetical protein